MGKIIRKIKKYKSYRIAAGLYSNIYIYIFRYAYLFLKYHVSIEDFFAYHLYDNSDSHGEYAKKNWKYSRSWKFAVYASKPESSKAWRFWHYCDYSFARLLYKGLDAVDYFHYEFYNIRHCKRKTFITEGGLKELNQIFNGAGDGSLLSDKAKFNRLFADYVGRKWIQTSGLTIEQFRSFCDGLEKVIIKPLDGAQGKGIFTANIDSETAIEELCNSILNGNYIVEEIVSQHDTIAKICNASVNTIRVYSVMNKSGMAEIISAVFRIGNGKQPTDNYSSGGMAAAVNIDTGIVCSSAVNKDGKRFMVHPHSNEIILGFRLPCWEKVMETVKKAHLLIPDLRYVAWDIAVTDEQKTVLIEANTYGGVSIQQHPTLTGLRQKYESLI